MKFLKKTSKKHTKKPEGACDRCQLTIWQGDKAICFHTDTEELYLCENCISEIYGEYTKDLL